MRTLRIFREVWVPGTWLDGLNRSMREAGHEPRGPVRAFYSSHDVYRLNAWCARCGRRAVAYVTVAHDGSHAILDARPMRSCDGSRTDDLDSQYFYSGLPGRVHKEEHHHA